jgi:hypothetical protein
MFASMICDPPLGQPTCISAGQDAVDFIVVLETASDASTNKQWQVALWHNFNPDESGWMSSNFEENTQNHQIVSSP